MRLPSVMRRRQLMGLFEFAQLSAKSRQYLDGGDGVGDVAMLLGGAESCRQIVRNI